MSYATTIRDAATRHYRSGQSDTSALDLQAVAGEIATAVEFFEQLQRGAKIWFGIGAPDDADGLDGDAYVNRATSDFFEKDAGQWVLMLSLRGQDGKTPVKNIDYFDGYTPVKGIDYKDGTNGKDGTTPVKNIDYFDGQDGADGNRTFWESREPGASDAGNVGDAWYHAIASDKLAIYECYRTATAAAGASQWRVRYTTPSAAATTVVTTPGTGSGTGTGAGGHIIQVNGTPLAAQGILDFTGLNIAGTNDSTGGKTRISFVNKNFYATTDFRDYTTVSTCYFDALTIPQIRKTGGIAQVMVSINSTSVTLLFDSAGLCDLTTGGATPLVVPAGATVTYSITYAGAAFAGTVRAQIAFA